MTRETKIGLFVGMGVVILIGILISDHLSVAQRQQQPDFGRAFPEGREAALPAADAVSTALPVSDRPVPAPGQVEPARPATHSVSEAPAAADTGADRLRVDLPKAIANLPNETKPATGSGSGSSRGVLPPGGQFEVVRSQSLTESEIRRVSGQLGGAVHIVQEGETLSQIARQHTGRTADWNIIYQANRAAIANPDALKPGTRLQIPTAAGSAQPSTTQVAAAPRTQAAPATAPYTLRSGDTLASVAEKFLGSQGKWRELYEMNKDRIKDPDRLSPGTVLRVPAR